MARTKAFVTEEVLDKAMRVFWAKGFEAASLSCLTEATGLNKSSLYNAFGDKENLFKLSIGRYNEVFVTELLSTLSNEKIEVALDQFFEVFIRQAKSKDNPNGCLVTSAFDQVETVPPEISKWLGKAFRDIEKTLGKRLEKAKTDGELKKDADVPTLVNFIMTFRRGMTVASRSQTNKEIAGSKKVMMKLLKESFLNI